MPTAFVLHLHKSGNFPPVFGDFSGVWIREIIVTHLGSAPSPFVSLLKGSQVSEGKQFISASSSKACAKFLSGYGLCLIFSPSLRFLVVWPLLHLHHAQQYKVEIESILQLHLVHKLRFLWYGHYYTCIMPNSTKLKLNQYCNYTLFTNFIRLSHCSRVEELCIKATKNTTRH